MEWKQELNCTCILTTNWLCTQSISLSLSIISTSVQMIGLIYSKVHERFWYRAKQKIFQAGHRVSVKTAALAGGKQAQTNVNDWAWLCANKASRMDIEPRVSYDFQVL